MSAKEYPILEQLYHTRKKKKGGLAKLGKERLDLEPRCERRTEDADTEHFFKQMRTISVTLRRRTKNHIKKISDEVKDHMERSKLKL